jgi:hypothetical protein
MIVHSGSVVWQVKYGCFFDLRSSPSQAGTPPTEIMKALFHFAIELRYESCWRGRRSTSYPPALRRSVCVLPNKEKASLERKNWPQSKAGLLVIELFSITVLFIPREEPCGLTVRLIGGRRFRTTADRKWGHPRLDSAMIIAFCPGLANHRDK